MRDDIIPLTTPIIDRHGKTIDSVKIRKGQIVRSFSPPFVNHAKRLYQIDIPIENLNMSPAFWGPTARLFDPSRWLSPESATIPLASHSHKSPATQDGPGVWPNMMTFIEGPRRCVGYKLAIMEIKIILFTLIRNFTYEQVEGMKIWKWCL
jgi:hypothetical protein